MDPITEDIALSFMPSIISEEGSFKSAPDRDVINEKIIEVLFTAPGERVHLPKFGCGLFNLVFEPNSPVLASAMEFSMGQALSRWLKDDIVVDAVRVESTAETAVAEIVYTRRYDLAKQAVRIRFK